MNSPPSPDPDPLTIVMYHYVREPGEGRFSRLKALATADFEAQLDHVARNHNVVGQAQVTAAWAGRGELPGRPCWLTFDDGFVDHYETVFPRLATRGWTGTFFPAAAPITGGRLLDVHRIHFVLAAADDPTFAYDALLEELEAPLLEELKQRYYRANRFDGPEVNFFKRVLQVGLAEARRTEICGRLFARFVSGDEADFAARLYMSVEQMGEMAEAGMTFGAHGDGHRWLGELARDEQASEIDASLRLLERITGRPPADWAISYPYGSYDETTLKLVRQAGAALGVTTKVGLAERGAPPLELPRLDTNDLPR